MGEPFAEPLGRPANDIGQRSELAVVFQVFGDVYDDLAADRIDGLHAEAESHRMARAAKQQQEPSRAEETPRPRRFYLGWLLRRATA